MFPLFLRIADIDGAIEIFKKLSSSVSNNKTGETMAVGGLLLFAKYQSIGLKHAQSKAERMEKDFLIKREFFLVKNEKNIKDKNDAGLPFLKIKLCYFGHFFVIFGFFSLFY